MANALVKERDSVLNKYNFIRLGAYRTASKLRSIQKTLGMSQISLSTISCIFERHQLQKNNLLFLDKHKIESVLSDVYFVIFQENEVNLISKSMVSFLLALYDSQMEGQIPVISFKICLTLLCLAKPKEKYCYFFNMLADSNNYLSKNGLKILLTYLVKVIDFIGEGSSFGSDLIEGTVKSCFETHSSTSGVSENGFISWLTKDPQLLIWLSVLYRMEISEEVTHASDCRICKTYPIIGFKYQCLKCLSLSICQTCFFSGKTNKKHKLKHPVQEYCHPQTAKQILKAFFLTIGNRICKKNYKPQYLPVVSTNSIIASGNLQTSSSKTIFTVSSASFVDTIFYKNLLNKILSLEKKSSELISEVENFYLSAGRKEINHKSQLKSLLLKHKMEINYQIEQLNLLRKEDFTVAQQSQDYSVIASTPAVKEFPFGQKKKTLNKNLENLSLIPDCISLTKEELDIEEPAFFLSFSDFGKTDGNFFSRNEKLDLSILSEYVNSYESESNGFASERRWLRNSKSNEDLLEELDSRLLLVLNKLEDLLKDPGLQDKIFCHDTKNK